MKLLISLYAATILIVTTSQAVLVEAGEGVKDNNMHRTISQEAAITTTQPGTNANTCFIIEDIHSAYDGSMNCATSEGLDFQVGEEGMILTNASEGHPNHDAADISIYDSYISQGLPNTDSLHRLELYDMVTTSNGSSTVAEVAEINDPSDGSDFQLFPDDNNSMFISNSDTNSLSNIASVPKPSKDTPTRLASLVTPPVGASVFPNEKSSMSKSYRLGRSNGSLSLH